jgi:CHAT domain-containing protein
LKAYRFLAIVPHGLLHYLPFQALFDGREYLLERYQVSYLPGASFLRYVSEAAARGHTVADVGACISLGNTNQGRLPYTVEEAADVAHILGGEALLEQRATLESLRTAAANSLVIHMATHGDFRPDNPLFSGLSLADGWLTTLDIFNLRIRASLVTLSACQTGRSVVGGGDELLGLMRSFLAAGAASLVTTLWAVEDRSTASLMHNFYSRLVAGKTKGAALRSAQLALMKDPDYSHPYFWAPFFLVGDPGKL